MHAPACADVLGGIAHGHLAAAQRAPGAAAGERISWMLQCEQMQQQLRLVLPTM